MCPGSYYALFEEGDPDISALCMGSECADIDTLTCCAPRDFCANAGFSCGEGQGLVENATGTMCAKSPCTEDPDQQTCCEEKGQCEDMRAGAARTFCNSFDYYTCEYGIKSNPHAIPCDGDCTKTLCCREATGEPLPDTRPPDMPADREVVQYKTRISGLIHSRMGGMLEDLDRQIKPVFADAAGVSPSQVATAYEAGSVLVTATITANDNQILQATTLPSTESITDAVLAVPNIDEAAIPGETIAAATPVGVKFLAGQDEAVVVTAPAPTPPTPAPTPPTPPTPQTAPPTAPTPAAPTPPAPPAPPAPTAPSDSEENTTRSSDAHRYFSVQTLLYLTICHFLS